MEDEIKKKIQGDSKRSEYQRTSTYNFQAPKLAKLPLTLSYITCF